MEQDYAATVELIKQKIQESADALAAASKLAASIDEDISTMYLEEDGKYIGRVISPLFNEMDEIGWSTSSLSC